jgi:hypothetical protein
MGNGQITQAPAGAATERLSLIESVLSETRLPRTPCPAGGFFYWVYSLVTLPAGPEAIRCRFTLRSRLRSKHMPMPEDRLKAQAQQSLGRFLRVETLIWRLPSCKPRIEADTDHRHSESALEKAQAALAAIRRLVFRIEDPAVRAEIEFKAEDLDLAIQSISRSSSE